LTLGCGDQPFDFVSLLFDSLLDSLFDSPFDSLFDSLFVVAGAADEDELSVDEFEEAAGAAEELLA
jgi:hypothetical protein